MIDVESLWTSESVVENLHALTAEFYNVMCNSEVPPVEEVAKMSRREFAYACKCGSNHVEHGSLWAVVSKKIRENTPDEDHPEFDEYAQLRKEFMDEVKHIHVRDYAEPFLKQTEEWKYVEAALQAQLAAMAEFEKFVCSSEITLETVTAHDIIVSYYCEEHGKDHFISPERNNHYRYLMGGNYIPKEYLPHLCKLSQQIIGRDTSAIFREWIELHPQNKVDSIGNRRLRKEKAERTALEIERQAAAAAIRVAGKSKNQLAAAKRVKNKAKGEAKAARARELRATRTTSASVSSVVYADPNLYILKPHLMSEDWLIEYHVCGRKVAYKKVSEALIYKHTNFQEGYDVYECPYCTNWHYGRKGHPVSPAVQAKRGLRWYKMNHRKANIFIHRIMMEEFV